MSYAAESSPLSALVYVFAVAAGLVALLFVSTMALTWLHWRRRPDRFTPDLRRVLAPESLAGIEDGELPDLGRARILTIADLVADRTLLRQVWEVARAVDAAAPARNAAARRADRDGPTQSEGPSATISPA